MSDGILEQIFKQNHKIIEQQQSILDAFKGSTAFTPPDEDKETNDIDDEMEKSLSKPEIELDSEGMPWVEGVHSDKKGKKKDGTWKVRKGSAEAAAKLKTDAPTAPTTPTAPVAPTAPTTPTAPVAPATDNKDKQLAMKSISVINDEHDVSYDLILNVLYDQLSVKSFDELTVDQYPQAAKLFSSWSDELTTSKSEIERIITAAGEQGSEAIKIFYANAGVSDLSDMSPDVFEGFLAEVVPYREQWEAYAESIK